MKLHLICAADALRPVLGYVKITRDVMVATNAHVMGVVPTKILFDESFIAGIPEKGMLIHKDDFAKIVSGTNHIWKSEGVIKIIVKNKRDALIETETEDNIGRYPIWEAVIPPAKDRTAELNEVGINFELAASLQKALGFSSCKLKFTSAKKAVYISDAFDPLDSSYGIVMPIKID